MSNKAKAFWEALGQVAVKAALYCAEHPEQVIGWVMAAKGKK